jgi:hypothetical protein
MPKYHVALSFAGEDRKYVEKVAAQLAADGVDVFYDKFEEATLWGKDLYAHLKDVYENRALFTVMFISKHYKDKVWPKHERESAQARALESNKEYILPAFFDESVSVPGLSKTTGRISLTDRTPEELAELIVKKLKDSGVELSAQFAYSDEAKADVDFPTPKGSKVAKILNDLKSYNWHTQSPSIKAIFDLDWSKVSLDQIFVLGRNIYQCACGSEHTAQGVLNNLRKELAQIPLESAIHLLNGMFFEVYFNKAGEFRGSKLKGAYLGHLLELQTVKKFEPSIAFIRRALEPYKGSLPFLPSTAPEKVVFNLEVKKSDPPQVRTLTLDGRDLLIKGDEDEEVFDRAWKLSFVKFTVKRLTTRLAEAWNIPPGQMQVMCDQKLDPTAEYRLPKGFHIGWPEA